MMTNKMVAFMTLYLNSFVLIKAIEGFCKVGQLVFSEKLRIIISRPSHLTFSQINL